MLSQIVEKRFISRASQHYCLNKHNLSHRLLKIGKTRQLFPTQLSPCDTSMNVDIQIWTFEKFW